MKMLICLSLAVSALAAPALAFAQTSSGPVTRAQVRAELVRLEQAGYNPADNDPNYPADIQAAEAKVAAQDANRLAVAAVGGATQAHLAQPGVAAQAISPRSIYAGGN